MTTPLDPTARFLSLFGAPATIAVSAPGRVNLIGEHTDYNGGFVLPMAIPQRTHVLLAPRGDRRVRAFSERIDPVVREYGVGQERRGAGWLDFVQGVTDVLTQAGHGIGGFDVWVSSDVPVGSGLSSSAALEVALLRALREAFGLGFDDVRLAMLAHRVETGFVGAPVGVMDQMACSLADEGSALFLDTRDLRFERVELPESAEVVVINSGVAHNHATGDYRTRRGECERAASLLGVTQLRDLPLEAVPRALERLPDPLGRRVRHVVTENARVLDTVAALRSGDLATLGRLLNASHDSQRDDFQVSVAEVDRLVELARSEPDVIGARLTGGGFGGSIVAAVKGGRGATVGQRIVERAGTTPRATLLVP